MGKETLLNLNTGLPVRKNFALKPQLDLIVIQLQSGGLWHKWNDEQFIPQVFHIEIKISMIIISCSDISKRPKIYPLGSSRPDPDVLLTLPVVTGPYSGWLCDTGGAYLAPAG